MNSSNLNYINFSQKELKELFTKSQSGNSKAFEELSKYVRNISYSYFLSKHRQGKIKNLDDVDDLTNNVYLTFAEQYQKVDNLEFWLRRVMFLSFINWYKKQKAHKTFELNTEFYISENGLSTADKMDAEKILEALETLSADKQKILKMRFWEGLKFHEIAENMQKSEDAVKKMFYRTIEELKNKF